MADDALGQEPLSVSLPHTMRLFTWRLFLGLRLATRAVVIWLLVASPHRASAVLITAACVCAGYDIRLARRLAHGTAPALDARLLLDTLDATGWSVALHGYSDLTAVVAGPLAVQWGLSYRWRALIVPTAVGGAVFAAQLATGRWQPSGAVWPLVGALCGITARAALLARLRWEAGVARTAREAAAGHAEMSGEAQVALGADSVVDLLARTAPIIAAHEQHPAPSALAGWKAELARAHSARAAYLMVVIRQWERSHNQGHDLSADADLRLLPGEGTLLLSAHQAAYLHQALDRMQLRGQVPVRVVQAASPGLAQVISVAGREIELPAQPRPRIGRLHPVPVLFLFGALTSALHALPAFDAVPWYVIAPVVASAVGATWAFQRRTAAGGDPEPATVVAAALLIAAADSALSSRFLGHSTGGALPRAPFLQIGWDLPLLVLYGPDLPRAARFAAAAALAATIALGAALVPALPPWSGMLAIAPWLLCVPVVCSGLRGALWRDAESLRERDERLYEQAVADGSRRGRRRVVEMTAHALDDLTRRFEQAANAMPLDLAAEVGRRLHEAGERLRAVDVA